MSDQTVGAQLRRLQKGCCPIHGYALTQVESYRYDVAGNEVGEGASYCIAGCPVKGCEVRVTATGPNDVTRLIAPTHLVERLEVGGPPQQRGSIRNVTIEGDPITYMCEVRTIHGHGLREGDRCWVEFGAYWAELPGKKIRHPGQWRECEVLRGPADTSADVHVRLRPSQRLKPRICRCNEGWVCEDHPDKPKDHDDCAGAGMKCENPSCPWWHGPMPAALDTQAERRKPS